MAKLLGILELKTDEERLKWLLDEFLQADFLNMSNEELIDWELKLVTFCDRGRGLTSITSSGDMATGLFQLREQLAAGLQLVMRANPHQAGLVGWPVALTGVTHYVTKETSSFTGPRDAVVLGIAAALIDTPLRERVVVCAAVKCGRIFYKQGRSRYCSDGCGTRERARKSRQLKKEGLREEAVRRAANSRSKTAGKRKREAV